MLSLKSFNSTSQLESLGSGPGECSLGFGLDEGSLAGPNECSLGSEPIEGSPLKAASTRKQMVATLDSPNMDTPIVGYCFAQAVSSCAL